MSCRGRVFLGICMFCSIGQSLAVPQLAAIEAEALNYLLFPDVMFDPAGNLVAEAGIRDVIWRAFPFIIAEKMCLFLYITMQVLALEELKYSAKVGRRGSRGREGREMFLKSCPHFGNVAEVCPIWERALVRDQRWLSLVGGDAVDYAAGTGRWDTDRRRSRRRSRRGPVVPPPTAAAFRRFASQACALPRRFFSVAGYIIPVSGGQDVAEDTVTEAPDTRTHCFLAPFFAFFFALRAAIFANASAALALLYFPPVRKSGPSSPRDLRSEKRFLFFRCRWRTTLEELKYRAKVGIGGVVGARDERCF